MNTFKRFYFSLLALFVVSLLLVVVSLFAIPAFLWFLITGKYLGWSDYLSEKAFDYVDRLFTNQTEILSR